MNNKLSKSRRKRRNLLKIFENKNRSKFSKDYQTYPFQGKVHRVILHSHSKDKDLKGQGVHHV